MPLQTRDLEFKVKKKDQQLATGKSQLEKLQKERTSYMRWASNNNEIERLSRFCLAYQYVTWMSKFDARNSELEEMENRLQALAQETKELSQRQQAGAVGIGSSL